MQHLAGRGDRHSQQDDVLEQKLSRQGQQRRKSAEAWFWRQTCVPIIFSRAPIMRSSRLGLGWVPRGDVPTQEVSHEPSNLVPVTLEREVASIKEMELHRLEVSLVRLGPGCRKDLVVLAPHDERGRLVLPEVCLPLRVERRITAVA